MVFFLELAIEIVAHPMKNCIFAGQYNINGIV